MLLGWLRPQRTAIEKRVRHLEEENCRLAEKTDLCEAMLAARGLAPPGDVPAGLLAAMAASATRADLETEHGSVIILLTGRPDDAAQVWQSVQDAGECDAEGADAAFRRLALPPGLRAVASRCSGGGSVLVVSTSITRAAQRQAVCELRDALRKRSSARGGTPPAVGRPALTVLGLTITTGIVAAALLAAVPHATPGLRPVQSATPRVTVARHAHRRKVRQSRLEPRGPGPALPAGALRRRSELAA